MPGKADAKTVVLHAGCKINIFLRITGRRSDGYHTLESFFLPIASPCDTLAVTPIPGEEIRFDCSDEGLVSSRNIVVKAYEAFAQATSFAPGLSVFLQKEIPYGAGLGGGSSDAAALLLHLSGMAARAGITPPDTAALYALAATLGADVPFFLLNKPAMVRGIGDCLEAVPNIFTGLHLVLVCPPVHVATAWAFAAWDKKKDAKERQGTLTKPGEEDTSPLVRGVSIHNDLSKVVCEEYPQVTEIVEQMYKMKADAASMSGSGSSVFGVFANGADAENTVHFFLGKGLRVFRHMM